MFVCIITLVLYMSIGFLYFLLFLIQKTCRYLSEPAGKITVYYLRIVSLCSLTSKATASTVRRFQSDCAFCLSSWTSIAWAVLMLLGVALLLDKQSHCLNPDGLAELVYAAGFFQAVTCLKKCFQVACKAGCLT